jgi:hypothetical protein
VKRMELLLAATLEAHNRIDRVPVFSVLSSEEYRAMRKCKLSTDEQRERTTIRLLRCALEEAEAAP